MNYVYFGNGYRARMLADELGQPLAYVTDTGEAGTLTLPQAAAMFPQAEYVAAVYNDAEPLRRMRAMGLRALRVWDIYERHGGQNFSEYHMMKRSEREDVKAIYQASRLWADATSYDLYNALILWRITHDDNALPLKSDPRNTYFDLPLTDYEIFVDCGAYQGETVREFIRRVNNFRAIYAYEPDYNNLAMLYTQDKRIHKMNMAVGESLCTMKYQTGKYSGAAGRVGDKGYTVPVIPLDMFYVDPTFIKMDIEGSEAAAIRGARQKLQNKPKLAITLYHNPEDIWEIPLLIHSIQPAYRFMLKKYADSCWEVVLYAY